MTVSLIVPLRAKGDASGTVVRLVRRGKQIRPMFYVERGKVCEKAMLVVHTPLQCPLGGHSNGLGWFEVGPCAGALGWNVFPAAAGAFPSLSA